MALPGQRHGRRHAREAARPLRRGGGPDRARWPTGSTATATPRCCRARSPRKAAFMNAMALDIAMGGSTNTVLHLLAIAHEAGVDFTMEDIDGLSRRIPCLCKVAPIFDVPRRGRQPGRRHPRHPRRARTRRAARHHGEARRRPHAEAGPRGLGHQRRPRPPNRRARCTAPLPAGRPSLVMGSQSSEWPSLDTDRAKGCIRDVAHAYQADGGLAVLTGNLAERGCIVKTAGVDASIHRFRGPARVFSSQEDACDGHPRRHGEGGRRGGHPLRGAARRTRACRRCCTRPRT